jgi:hypothetical protein
LKDERQISEAMNMTTQREEFEAAGKLSEQLRRVSQTPIVDDDYPEVRQDYESALASLIDKMKANGRFNEGNRFGVRAQ